MVDAVANLASNPALGTTDVVFDSLNRPVSTTYSDGTPTVSYTYDSQGRRSQMVDGSGTTVYGFDSADRVASVTRGADVFTYAYDAAGNVTSRTYPDGTVVAGTFDDAGQQVTTTEPAGTVQFAYDVAGNPISSTFPSGVTRTTSFDNGSRVTVVSNTNGTGVLSKFTYSRDANGNPTAIDYANGTGLVPVESQRLTYDNADRLTKVCQTATTCATANQTVWTYDKNGNRLTEKAGAAAQSVYTYDATDQLSAISGAGAKTFTYNANGDQITAGADTATFNTARQTTGATVRGVATTFAYDGNGNRHTITSAGVSTSELWDTVGGLPNLAIERNSAGVVQRRYSYGRGTETLGYTDSTASTQGWYLTDALGSVANITNQTGVSVATYTYNPFGTQRLNTTTPGYAANPLKYTGQHLDPTGNYNLRARQYNPSLGRFTQVDPLAADTDGAYPSAYTYSNNNPTMFTDPSGMRVGFGEDGGIASASFATKDTPPTTKVIIRKGNRCVTTAATPAQRKKNPLAPSVATKCTKIPAPTTTLRQRLFGQYSGQLVSGNFKSVTVGFSWDLEQGKARFLSIDLVGHNLNAAESDDPKYSSAIFDFEICGPEGCYRRLAVNAQTTGPLLDVSQRVQGIGIGLDAKIRLTGYSYGDALESGVCTIRATAGAKCS